MCLVSTQSYCYCELKSICPKAFEFGSRPGEDDNVAFASSERAVSDIFHNDFYHSLYQTNHEEVLVR